MFQVAGMRITTLKVRKVSTEQLVSTERRLEKTVWICFALFWTGVAIVEIASIVCQAKASNSESCLNGFWIHIFTQKLNAIWFGALFILMVICGVPLGIVSKKANRNRELSSYIKF